MKLFYYTRSDQVENFGDSLNPWLWSNFISQELDNDETTTFIGIGTIINNFLPQRAFNAKHFVIFSSGVGYEKEPLPPLQQCSTIYCVRGPLSAQKLGLDEDVAVADGALLLRRVFQPRESKDCEFAFMPHVEHAMLGDELLLEACNQANIRYIDPRWPIPDILSLISRTEVLLAEAMHGAIASEALRVPWIPIVTSSRILSFKWLDWCASVNLLYQPAYISPLVSCYPFEAENEEFNQNWLDELKQTNASESDKIRKSQGAIIAQELLQISQSKQPHLSKDEHIENLTDELETRLSIFKSDFRSGKFKKNGG